MQGFIDIDWCGDLRERKRTSRFVYNLESGVVCWASKKQNIVPLSSTEAEYIALCATCCHGFWIKKIMCDFGIQCDGSIPICCDNKSYLAWEIQTHPSEVSLHQRNS